ncbi:MAG TPA: LD-carboxypeptidase [Vicinamibacterales bacterium]|jgi:muramoyltetrapeptide carboxypeptidase
MRKPRALVSGDRLAIVAPASTFKREEFDLGVEEIHRLGFEAVFDESVFERRRYLAGPAETRAAALTKAWRDPTIAGIIAVRGGYGSAQVLPLVDPSDARAARKPFIGYSDLTAVLTFLTLRCDLVAFHGPMLAGRLARGVDGYDRSSFLNALTRAQPLGELAAPKLESFRPGDVRGLIFGGTMTQLVASFGTPFAFSPPTGHVLFLEEVGERPYRLDRIVTQLTQAGILAKAAAIVIGELRDCDEPSGEPTARAVMADLFADFPGPVLFGFPSGHTVGAPVTLPLGVRCRVVGGAHPALIVEESAVEAG